VEEKISGALVFTLPNLNFFNSEKKESVHTWPNNTCYTSDHEKHKSYMNLVSMLIHYGLMFRAKDKSYKNLSMLIHSGLTFRA
jgi:hypothetical protein